MKEHKVRRKYFIIINMYKLLKNKQEDSLKHVFIETLMTPMDFPIILMFTRRSTDVF